MLSWLLDVPIVSTEINKFFLLLTVLAIVNINGLRYQEERLLDDGPPDGLLNVERSGERWLGNLQELLPRIRTLSARRGNEQVPTPPENVVQSTVNYKQDEGNEFTARDYIPKRKPCPDTDNQKTGSFEKHNPRKGNSEKSHRCPMKQADVWQKLSGTGIWCMLGVIIFLLLLMLVCMLCYMIYWWKKAEQDYECLLISKAPSSADFYYCSSGTCCHCGQGQGQGPKYIYYKDGLENE